MNNNNNKTHTKEKEWQHILLLFVSGLTLFETLTGLLIYFLPFSISNQVNVIFHTVMGLVFVIPFAWYLFRHWIIYWSTPVNHFKFTGYVLMVSLLILVVTGLILAWQAVFGIRINSTVDLIHTIATFAMIAFIVPHIILIIIRNFKSGHAENMVPVVKAVKQFIWSTIGIAFVLFVLAGLWVFAYDKPVFNNSFPEDYSYLLGKDRPFAPSLATTSTGGAFDPGSMGGSESCGTTGCHKEILEEWEASAHRYSAMDVGFQKVQSVMAEQNGSESTRYCGGCHDPISLFSGTKNIGIENLSNLTGYQEGVSCIICHAIKETDIKGNANYVVTQPNRYMYELKEDKSAKFISDFLIRSYPDYHIKTFQHKLFKSPEFCAACHKQFIDKEVNNVGWVQLQNQYDNWKNSRWNHPGEPNKTIECRECHMPLTASADPGNGDDLDYNRTPDDGKHRSHRFLAANQFMPLALKLPGAEEHVALTEKWLQGKIEIPEISEKWQDGPAVPIELVVPDSVYPGKEVNIETMITNNKVGHDFPTGPLDIIQAWVELTVTDQDSNVVYTSGHIDERKFVQPGSFIFKVEPVDQYGNLIDKHNLWEMVGVRFRRAMFPGFSDKAEYTFACPSMVQPVEEKPGSEPLNSAFGFKAPGKQVTELHVTARLLYRKFDQYLLNFLFGEESGITAPITVLSGDVKTIEVLNGTPVAFNTNPDKVSGNTISSGKSGGK